MKAKLISRLRCPGRKNKSICTGRLHLREKPPAKFNTEETDLVEGGLGCDECNALYPVIAGVAILMPEVLSWLRANYYYISAGAASATGIGSEMRLWLESQDWHLGNQFSTNYYEENRWVNMFIATHYDESPAGSDHLSALGRSLAAQPQVFEVVDEMLKKYIRSPLDNALDVGTNVGGMARCIARHVKDVIGIDNAYNPVLAARAIHSGSPLPMREYRRYLDGHHYELRPLPDEIENTEFLVASSFNIPVTGSFQLITALNIVDSVADPTELLGQLSNRLAPSGLLLVTSPYSWASDDTPVECWIGASQNNPSSEAVKEVIRSFGFEILEEADHVPWILREHQRWYRTFLNHCILARKLN